MPLESGTLIPDLDANNPLGSDVKSEGDDHLRLVKRCVQGSFPAFVGTTAIPKSVSLTEDQINDAALKSEAATISGAWTFTAQVDHEAAVVMANDIALQLKFSGGTNVDFAKMSAADRMEVGNASNHMDFFAASGANANRYFIGGVEVARHGNLADGGVIVGDLQGFFKKAGFRNPGVNSLSVSGNTEQSREGQYYRINGNDVILTVESLEIGTSIRLLIGGAASRFTMVEGAGVTLRWLQGGVSSTGGRSVALSSVVDMYWRTATDVDIWGNGIS